MSSDANKNLLCKSNYFFMIPLQQCGFTYTQSITFFIMLFYCRTDAIFQAVHENAFEILECLLSESKPQQKQQSFYNHRDHHDRHCSSTTNAKDYQKRQRRQQDVPAALSSSSTESKAAALPESSSSTLPPPPPDQSINIQKTTTTKGKDSRGNKAVVLNREKPSNNANNNSRSSSKGHEQDDDGDGRIDDDDHVLCPFYYALYYAPSHPSKRESLVRLLQSYYKCKCLEEIASCHQSNFWGYTAKENAEQARNCTAVAGDDEVKECWNVVRNSYVNFSGWWRWWYAKSVPPAGYGALHVDDSVQNYTTQQYHAHDHHPYQCDPIPSTSSFVDVDNENSIKFLLPAESSSKGGEENELSWSNLFPYKIYKIEGKCHVIKENESSSTPSPISVSSSSSSPTPAATVNTTTTRVHKRPPSSYVVLVGPLKLSCITREVIRDQIKFCGSRGTRSIKRSCKNINQTTTSASANGSTLEQQNERSQRSGESTVAPEPLELWLKSEDYFNRMNFRKSLETLMMPSSLMDYILYRNIHWSESRNCSTLLSSSRIGIFRGRDENEHTTAAATTDADDDNAGENNELSNNIKLIKRDLELNINYYAIYIY